MKSLNLVTTLAIAASLLVSATGCRHQPKSVTTIPRTNLTPIGEDPSANIKLPPGSKGPGVDRSNTLNQDGGPNGRNIGDVTTKPFDPNDPKNSNQVRPQGDLPENREALAAETVYFDYDRSSVKSSEVPKVQRVATYLKNQPNALLRVEGNCDERGTEEYNRSLGERRALAVRELLVASGIGPDRISTVTFGEDKPADPGHDDAAWSKNRRADFVVLTPTGNAPLQ